MKTKSLVVLLVFLGLSCCSPVDNREKRTVFDQPCLTTKDCQGFNLECVIIHGEGYGHCVTSPNGNVGKRRHSHDSHYISVPSTTKKEDLQRTVDNAGLKKLRMDKRSTHRSSGIETGIGDPKNIETKRETRHKRSLKGQHRVPRESTVLQNLNTNSVHLLRNTDLDGVVAPANVGRFLRKKDAGFVKRDVSETEKDTDKNYDYFESNNDDRVDDENVDTEQEIDALMESLDSDRRKRNSDTLSKSKRNANDEIDEMLSELNGDKNDDDDDNKEYDDENNDEEDNDEEDDDDAEDSDDDSDDEDRKKRDVDNSDADDFDDDDEELGDENEQAYDADDADDEDEGEDEDEEGEDDEDDDDEDDEDDDDDDDGQEGVDESELESLISRKKRSVEDESKDEDDDDEDNDDEEDNDEEDEEDDDDEEEEEDDDDDDDDDNEEEDEEDDEKEKKNHEDEKDDTDRNKDANGDDQTAAELLAEEKKLTDLIDLLSREKRGALDETSEKKELSKRSIFDARDLNHKNRYTDDDDDEDDDDDDDDEEEEDDDDDDDDDDDEGDDDGEDDDEEDDDKERKDLETTKSVDASDLIKILSRKKRSSDDDDDDEEAGDDDEEEEEEEDEGDEEDDDDDENEKDDEDENNGDAEDDGWNKAVEPIDDAKLLELLSRDERDINPGKGANIKPTPGGEKPAPVNNPGKGAITKPTPGGGKPAPVNNHGKSAIKKNPGGRKPAPVNNHGKGANIKPVRGGRKPAPVNNHGKGANIKPVRGGGKSAPVNNHGKGANIKPVRGGRRPAQVNNNGKGANIKPVPGGRKPAQVNNNGKGANIKPVPGGGKPALGGKRHQIRKWGQTRQQGRHRSPWGFGRQKGLGKPGRHNKLRELLGFWKKLNKLKIKRTKRSGYSDMLDFFKGVPFIPKSENTTPQNVDTGNWTNIDNATITAEHKEKREAAMDYSAYPIGKNEMFDKSNVDKDDLDELVIDSDYTDDDDIMGGTQITIDRKKRSSRHIDSSEGNGFISSAEALEEIDEDPNSGV